MKFKIFAIICFLNSFSGVLKCLFVEKNCLESFWYLFSRKERGIYFMLSKGATLHCFIIESLQLSDSFALGLHVTSLFLQPKA